ncbi:protein kinase [bacterium]|nr:protein kinase [bacterium]
MAEPQKDSLIGSRIREYEILELLGKGGMGAVYRARHAFLDEERAIKVIHARLAGGSSFIDRFIREAKILTKLRHANLVQLYEFGTLETDSFFMVMELIRGESVWHRIRRVGRIPISDAIRIMRQAASGLQCAHQNGIIHRDISPDNLILLNDREPEVTKVIDFGIAKPLLETSLQLTAVNLFIGKPEYCSPEQCTLSGERQTLDGRSDIYSLAVTFYQMLTGNLPFYSKSPQGYFMKHAHEMPSPPSFYFPAGTFPESLDRLILKALAKRREERHQTIDEFLAELELSTTQPVPLVPLLSEPETGEVFAGRYLIEGKLGHGEMGMVFKALDKILEIPVALKTVSLDIAEDEKTLARFKREVILARKVTHPNVCRVYDIGEQNGVHYVSMEFVEGRTLADYMRTQGRLPAETSIPILEQVLHAIRETHRAGIIHRDLKPQNIMIDVRSRLKIMDFGISLSADYSRITQTGSLLGSPHYMAPEVFEEKAVDARADLYSIGVLMYSLLTGRLPFDGPTPVAVIYAHLKADPPRPSEIVPAFSADLERIIMKALQKEPENRYQSAEEILNDLASFGQPVSDPQLQASEQLTHKLIAEHKFAQAIKVLQSLLKDQPDNPRWKKLLKNALSEKTKRDIRHTRLFIRKGNFAQAQFVLERIGNIQLEGTGVLNQLKKLQDQLIAGKKQAVGSYLQEAEDRLERKDYLAAMASLESAWHLQPNDPDIISMQQRIQLAREDEFTEKYNRKMDEARSLFAQGDEEQAFGIAQEILEENSSHRAAKELRDQILESRWEKVQDQIKQGLELAVQPLSFCDFEVASKLLTKLHANLGIDTCRKEIDRIRKAVVSLESAFQAEQYDQVPRILNKLLTKDPFGWLEPHQSVFGEIETSAAEKLFERDKLLTEAFSETRNLLDSGHYVDALNRIDTLRSQISLPEADELRLEILSAYRGARLQEAQEFASGLEWERAMECWNEILQLFPDSEEIQQALSDAENHLREEFYIQEELLRQLKECYSLVLKEHWQEAQNKVEKLLKSIQPGYRLIEWERQIETLEAEILLHTREQQKHLEDVSEELRKIKGLYKQGAYAEALERISPLLEKDVVEQEALELKSSIEEAINAQHTAQRLQSALQKGKEYYDRHRWQKAIECWKKASSLSDEPYLKEWIEQAQQRLKKERQIRLSIIAMLAEAEELIFYGNFEEAHRKLDKSRKALAEFSFDDLAEQVRYVSNKLDAEIQKDEAFRTSIQGELEEAALLYHQRLYHQALEKLDQVLDQQPEMEPAMQLRAQIEAAEAENRNVLETIRAVVKLVVKREFKHLPDLLIRLKETASRTAYAEDGDSIIDELPMLVIEIESGDISRMRARMDRLFSRSLLLLEYETVLRDFAESVEIKKQKEADLGVILQKGLQYLESGDREGALGALESFHRVLPEKHQRIRSPKIDINKTGSLTEDDLKITEVELETLQHQLRHSEVENILSAAREILNQGDILGAQELFMQVLELEPENETAREGLRHIDQSSTQSRKDAK